MGQRGSCCDLCQNVLSTFSPKNFIASRLTFKSLIHFKFIFVYGVRQHSSFIHLHVAVQFSQHHLPKRLSFLHCIVLPPLSRIRCPWVHGLISRLLSLFHWSIFLFLGQSGGLIPPAPFFFLKIAWLFGVYCVFILIVKMFFLIL